MKAFLAAWCEEALTFMFDDSDVDLESQVAVVHTGYRTVRKFAALEDERQGIEVDPTGVTSQSRTLVNLAL